MKGWEETGKPGEVSLPRDFSFIVVMIVWLDSEKTVPWSSQSPKLLFPGARDRDKNCDLIGFSTAG